MKNNKMNEPADISIYIQDKGIILKEKSIIAFQKSDGKIVAYGTEAGQLAEKDTKNLEVISPLRQGVVQDFTAASKLFSLLLARALGKRPVLKRAMALCVPKGATQVERKALEETLLCAGAGRVFLAEAPLEQLIRELPERFPGEYRRIKIIIGIAKEEPERYVEESLRAVMAYAAQENIPPERVRELLENLQADESSRRAQAI